MNKLYIFCILLLSSSLLTADEEIIKSKLKNVLPADTVIESIEPSPSVSYTHLRAHET